MTIFIIIVASYHVLYAGLEFITDGQRMNTIQQHRIYGKKMNENSSFACKSLRVHLFCKTHMATTELMLRHEH